MRGTLRKTAVPTYIILRDKSPLSTTDITPAATFSWTTLFHLHYDLFNNPSNMTYLLDMEQKVSKKLHVTYFTQISISHNHLHLRNNLTNHPSR